MARAVERLVARNLLPSGDGIKSKASLKKKSKAERKLKQRRREEIKQQRAFYKGIPITPHKRTKQSSNAARKEQQAQIDSLKAEISNELEKSALFVKRERSVADAPPGWEGLTPGLAPVGYDPDESSDEEEPY